MRQSHKEVGGTRLHYIGKKGSHFCFKREGKCGWSDVAFYLLILRTLSYRILTTSHLARSSHTLFHSSEVLILRLYC